MDNMTTQSTTQVAFNIPSNEHNQTTAMESQGPLPGGPLRKGLDYLTRALERRIDRQVLAAQARASESSPISDSDLDSDMSEKPRYM